MDWNIISVTLCYFCSSKKNIVLANHKCLEFITKKEKKKNEKEKKIHTYNPQSIIVHCFSSTFTHFDWIPQGVKTTFQSEQELLKSPMDIKEVKRC